MAALCLAYVVLGKIGLGLAFYNSSATPVWPPTGLALAALLLGGYRYWPAVFVGAFITNSLTQGTPLTSFGIATGNTLEALVGTALVRRFAGGVQAVQTWNGFYGFAALGAVAGPAVSATIGVTTLYTAGYVSSSTAATTWITWWAGDAAGAILVTPLILFWWKQAIPRVSRRGFLEGAVFLAALGAVVFIVFTSWPLEAPGPLLFLLMPLPVWAAYRFGPRGTVTVVATLNLLAVAATVDGLGPLRDLSPNTALLVLEVFIAILCLTAVPLALVVQERERAAAELARLNRDLERRISERTAALRDLVASLETFNHAVSHDLRGPLRVASLRAEMATSDAAEPELVREHASEILLATGQMRRIVENLLRLTNSNQPLVLKRVDVTAMTSTLLKRLASTSPGRDVHVDVASGMSVVADEALLEIVLANLLENAWKFTARRRDARIEVRAEPSSAGDWIIVRDNGVGFAPSEAMELFKPFSRRSTAAGFEGHGLGLATVQRIVQRHGGEIRAEGKLGEGSEFRFRMSPTAPIDDPDTRSARVTSPRERGRVGPP